jgi:hypothetical protein
MLLDSAKYRSALSALGPRPANFVVPPPVFQEWLEAKSLPPALVRFLIENAVSEGLPFASGTGGMWTPDNIMALNDQESAILAAGLLAIGNTGNGDFIVIDLAEGVNGVGFVSHDELWDAAPTNVREIFISVDESIHLLLNGMASEDRRWKEASERQKERKYPVDYCSALVRKDRMALADQIKAAFASTPSPGEGFDDISATEQDEGIVDYFRGTTWRGHSVAALRYHSAALSFFTGPAFRYWLPAFMLASLEDAEAADVIPESIASSMQKAERLNLFTAAELRAIAAFLLDFA